MSLSHVPPDRQQEIDRLRAELAAKDKRIEELEAELKELREHERTCDRDD